MGQAHGVPRGPVPVDGHDLSAHDVGGGHIAVETGHQGGGDLVTATAHDGGVAGRIVQARHQPAVDGEKRRHRPGVTPVDMAGIGVDEITQCRPVGRRLLGLVHRSAS
jgi:hypothetical protein